MTVFDITDLSAFGGKGTKGAVFKLTGNHVIVLGVTLILFFLYLQKDIKE